MLVDNISQSTLPIYITYPYPFSFKVSRFCSLRNLDPILCRTKEPVPVSLPQWERQHKTEGCFAFAFIQITINALLLAALCSFFSHNFQLKKRIHVRQFWINKLQKCQLGFLLSTLHKMCVLTSTYVCTQVQFEFEKFELLKNRGLANQEGMDDNSYN